MRERKTVTLQVGDEIEYEDSSPGMGGIGASDTKTAQVIGFTGDGVVLTREYRTKSLTPGIRLDAISAVRRHVGGQLEEIYRRA